MCDFLTIDRAAETNYWAAKARLESAQREKLEAATEFLAAREALSQILEAHWPGQGECSPVSGYDNPTYGQHNTRQRRAGLLY